jgi:WD40 repeat protein
MEPWLKLSPSGRYVITSGEASVWRLDQKPTFLYRLCDGSNRLHRYGVLESSFSRDEHILATSGYESMLHEGDSKTAHRITVWDVASGSQRALLEIGEKCFCFAVSNNSKFIVTMSAAVDNPWDDKAEIYRLSIWDSDTGELRATRTTDARKTNSLVHYPVEVCCSPDDRLIAVGHMLHAEVWETPEEAKD